MNHVLEWDRLVEITKKVQPFRGSDNRYPLVQRSHNTKCFYVEEREGEKIFKITYGHQYDEVFHTKEEYEATPDKIHCINWTDDETKKYVSYRTKPNELGVVRSDNTFEFTGRWYGQGSNMILSSWNRGNFYNSSRQGGMVYKDGGLDIFHPVFRGLRIHINTSQPHESCQYKVYGKKVSRKNSKQFLTRYEDFYKINHVMFKTMQSDAIKEVAWDLIQQIIPKIENGYPYFMPDEVKQMMIERAERDLNESPVDSAILYCMVYGINNMYQYGKARGEPKNYYNTKEIDSIYLYNNMKRKLNKELYKANPQVFNIVEHKAGKYFSPSEWGVTVEVNGKEVEQY